MEIRLLIIGIFHNNIHQSDLMRGNDPFPSVRILFGEGLMQISKSLDLRFHRKSGTVEFVDEGSFNSSELFQ